MQRLSLLLCLALFLPRLASAQEIPRRNGEWVDTWSEPNPGVRYLHRTADDPALSVHALVIDLSREGVEIVTTSQAERWDSISGFAQHRGAVAAVNGGFWGMMQRPAGLAAGDGEVWSNSAPSEGFGHVAVRQDGRVRIYAPGEAEDERSLGRLRGTVSGRPMLVSSGALLTERLDAFATANLKQPRTAVGVSRNGRRVVLAVADGRQGHSRGMTLYQLGRLMVELGADRAINLDGGGSSAMYLERAGGLISSPARGRWARALHLGEDDTVRVRTRHGEREVCVRGVEREVMNHLAVLAPSRRVEVAANSSPLLDGLGHLAVEDRVQRHRATLGVSHRRPFRIGRLREWLYPSLYVAVPLTALALFGFALRRLARGRRRALT